MPRLKLTAENYFSKEADMQYMSASQFKAFRKCEAAAMAELRGEWGKKETLSLQVGSYVDAYFSGELEQFKAENPGIFRKDGGLKADFAHAQKVTERVERDTLARMLLSGEHQTIKTGKIAGVWFKTKIDSLLTERYVEAICKRFPLVKELVPFGGGMLVDLKYMKDFEDIWDDELRERVSFVEFWGYDTQGAIYQKIDGNMLPFVILAVTKETEPDLEAIYIPDEDLAFCLSEVEALAPRYDAIKRGEIDAEPCGKCAYCRSRKHLSAIKHYKNIKVQNEMECL